MSEEHKGDAANTSARGTDHEEGCVHLLDGSNDGTMDTTSHR